MSLLTPGHTLSCLIQATREMIRSGNTPMASYLAKRCDSCSLIDLCQPKLLGKGQNVETWLRGQIAEES